jgi:hypothetical protein
MTPVCVLTYRCVIRSVAIDARPGKCVSRSRSPANNRDLRPDAFEPQLKEENRVEPQPRCMAQGVKRFQNLRDARIRETNPRAPFPEVRRAPPEISEVLGSEERRDHLINDTLASDVRRLYRLLGRTK